MPKNLVIVESPAKAKTIEKYLGKDFEVYSSFGHIVDLPKKDMGIDISNNFQPKYEISADKKEIVTKLKKIAKKSDIIWLASDEDREGEAIAWHLYNQLNLSSKNTKRIVFHEVTKNAILKAIENPRVIDKNLVNAQQARRILDRIVGFEMSPVLWRKVKPGLSAGRVQSVAVRLIAEREKEIIDFTPVISYRISGIFQNSEKKLIKTSLNKELSDYTSAKILLEKCINKDFIIDAIEVKPAKRSPAAPFTTSTLQQEAARKLGMSVSRTMRIAQQLYEIGHITYMRTDSVNLAQDAINSAKEVIIKDYGTKYSKIRNYSAKNKGAQEAHEAIRPTNFSIQNPVADASQNRLYQLIWKRALASQMADAELEKTQIDISTPTIKEKFIAKGEVIIFDGFLRLYQESQDEDNNIEDSGMLPKVKKGESIKNNSIVALEKYTRPLGRYSEASLVKKLEELGIGRPSTYAPTLSTIQVRGYVEILSKKPLQRSLKKIELISNNIIETVENENYGAEKNKFFPTDIGVVVNGFLTQHFSTVLDFGFTAKIEEEFDNIAEGKEEWTAMMHNFYNKFHAKIIEVGEKAEKAKGERLLGKDPETNKNVYAKIGKFGAMIQIGENDDDPRPRYASLLKTQQLSTITFKEALLLFTLPRTLGTYKEKEIIVNAGRFGPYVKYEEKFISIPSEEDVMTISLEKAIELIIKKLQEDAPISHYNNMEVTKGKGRFGPFIKWNNMFININKKYDYDHLSPQDIKTLIEDKLKKESEKIVQNWEKEGIRIEKARWGRHNIIKGKLKIELAKEIDPLKLSLKEVQNLLDTKFKKKK